MTGPDPGRLRRALLRWSRSHGRIFPWRETTEPFRVLVAELLLQKTPSWKVAPVYEQLFAKWPGPDEMAAAPVGQLEQVIRPLGLIRRAAKLKAVAETVAKSGEVPGDVRQLQELPGVGEYVARAVACFALGDSVPLVDGVSGRVYRRYFGVAGEGEPARDPRLWELAGRVVGRHARKVNWAVLDLGATVCKARRPDCPTCPARGSCAWRRAESGE
jgi:A/G-specific adenine glycosylase